MGSCRLENFVSIPLSGKVAVNDNELCLSCNRDASLHHHAPATEWCEALDAAIVETLAPSTPHPHSPINIPQAETRLVAEHHRLPLTPVPAEMFAAPTKAGLLLLSSHCWLLCSLSCSEMGSLEAVSHSLIRYPCIVPSHNTSLGDLRTSAPGSVLDISCCLEFLFPFGDGPRAYT